jgi:GT2 family glycosyltransferase
MYVEETDLCWRLRLLGYRVAVAPESVVWHLDQGGASPHVRYLKHRNTLVTLLKNFTPRQLRRDFPARVALDLLTLAYVATRNEAGWVRDIVAAYCWVIRRLPAILRKRRTAQRLRRLSDHESEALLLDTSLAFEYFLRGRTRFSDLPFATHAAVPEQRRPAAGRAY